MFHAGTTRRPASRTIPHRYLLFILFTSTMILVHTSLFFVFASSSSINDSRDPSTRDNGGNSGSRREKRVGLGLHENDATGGEIGRLEDSRKGRAETDYRAASREIEKNEGKWSLGREMRVGLGNGLYGAIGEEKKRPDDHGMAQMQPKNRAAGGEMDKFESSWGWQRERKLDYGGMMHGSTGGETGEPEDRRRAQLQRENRAANAEMEKNEGSLGWRGEVQGGSGGGTYSETGGEAGRSDDRRKDEVKPQNRVATGESESNMVDWKWRGKAEVNLGANGHDGIIGGMESSSDHRRAQVELKESGELIKRMQSNRNLGWRKVQDAVLGAQGFGEDHSEMNERTQKNRRTNYLKMNDDLIDESKELTKNDRRAGQSNQMNEIVPNNGRVKFLVMKDGELINGNGGLATGGRQVGQQVEPSKQDQVNERSDVNKLYKGALNDRNWDYARWRAASILQSKETTEANDFSPKYDARMRFQPLRGGEVRSILPADRDAHTDFMREELIKKSREMHELSKKKRATNDFNRPLPRQITLTFKEPPFVGFNDKLIILGARFTRTLNSPLIYFDVFLQGTTKILWKRPGDGVVRMKLMKPELASTLLDFPLPRMAPNFSLSCNFGNDNKYVTSISVLPNFNHDVKIQPMYAILRCDVTQAAREINDEVNQIYTIVLSSSHDGHVRFNIPFSTSSIGLGGPENHSAVPFHKRAPIKLTVCLGGLSSLGLHHIPEFVQHYLRMGAEHVMLGFQMTGPDDTSNEHKLVMEYLNKTLEPLLIRGLLSLQIMDMGGPNALFDMELAARNYIKIHFYNGCLYHAKAFSEYVANFDLDELWMPPWHETEEMPNLVRTLETQITPDPQCEDFCYVTFPSYAIWQLAKVKALMGTARDIRKGVSFKYRTNFTNLIWKKPIAKTKNVFGSGFHSFGSCLKNGQPDSYHPTLEKERGNCAFRAPSTVGAMHHFLSTFYGWQTEGALEWFPPFVRDEYSLLIEKFKYTVRDLEVVTANGVRERITFNAVIGDEPFVFKGSEVS